MFNHRVVPISPRTWSRAFVSVAMSRLLWTVPRSVRPHHTPLSYGSLGAGDEGHADFG